MPAMLMIDWRPLQLPLALLACLLACPAQAERFRLASGDQLVGRPLQIVSQYEDTFIEIGRAHNLGYEELRRANPDVDPWLPGAGTQIALPTQHVLPAGEQSGLVVNVAEFRLYYFYTEGETRFVATMPVSVGRMDWATPLGAARVVARVTRPSWYPPASVRAEYAAEGRELPSVVPPGPDNPLGNYALRLDIPGYLIHGTNRPAGVGMRVTHGCIRLFPEDIAWLFPQVDLNTPVRIVNQPLKFGWLGDELFLEVHPPLASNEQDTETAGMTLVTRELIRATKDRRAEVDWQKIAVAFRAKTGLPVSVGKAVMSRDLPET
jgi:L,D-transpeptidase ErfK/SrfK